MLADNLPADVQASTIPRAASAKELDPLQSARHECAHNWLGEGSKASVVAPRPGFLWRRACLIMSRGQMVAV